MPARLGGCAGARDVEAQRWRGLSYTWVGVGRRVLGGSGSSSFLQMVREYNIIYTTLRLPFQFFTIFFVVSVQFVQFRILKKY